MMVANSFDLWQKDQFFPAAEEVQESADKMESAYRSWIRERREGRQPDELDELCSELQTTLSTAKWQLEEFERAVRLSYGHRSHHCEDNETARHRQFIEAIEDKISCVETSLRESFSEQGKQPFHWVNLDEEECNDLAAFLSGAPQSLNTAKDTSTDLRPFMGGSTRDLSNHKGKEVELDCNDAYNINTLNDVNCLKDVSVIDKVAEHIIEIEPEMSRMREEIMCPVDRTMGARKTRGSPKFGDLRIAVPDEDLENKLMGSIEVTPKEKGYKPVFWQLFDRAGGFQRQQYSMPHLQFGNSVRLMLVLMYLLCSIHRDRKGCSTADDMNKRHWSGLEYKKSVQKEIRRRGMVGLYKGHDWTIL